ncbi:hypothetical protein Taro_045967 [Colocasia esculenta]|uniref:Uncharacterized protein n=1 Tax=Colocasia esculenta TaxID=4460 RepID=A0A843WXV6_COLES|nr:hypothetical protein [Colocasia esculenta]
MAGPVVGASIKILDVGKELMGEVIPLKMGQRLYQLRGLRASTWYEVKISYPASVCLPTSILVFVNIIFLFNIPARFSIQLKRGVSDMYFGTNRRLLNTEKLIFKADIDKLIEAYVLVTVEAAGIVAKPHARERDTVLFNIVCDELSFGIPHKAWCVGIVAVLCLVLAVIAPYHLPSRFLSRNQIDEQRELASLKAS